MRQEAPQSRTVRGSISAALDSAHAHSLPPSIPLAGEDGNKSLSEIAQRDLDAALHLLADRAQYITGANGAAIALRSAGGKDLLCRASIGPNAPDLGALLSTEFGLSGESVRTRQLLRCDDAERDSRVNREVCRQLGIASVVVMPVVHDEEVLGVFELFSGKTNAFGARDLSALERLSEMVDTAVRLARAAEGLPDPLTKADGAVEGIQSFEETQVEPGQSEDRRSHAAVLSSTEEATVREVESIVTEKVSQKEPAQESVRLVTSGISSQALDVMPTQSPSGEPLPATAAPEATPPAKPPKRSLLWSAPETATEAQNSAEKTDTVQSEIPPVLRGLHKCQACGFPVSAGRTFCVECEEKKWRGHRLPRAAPDTAPQKPGLQNAKSQNKQMPILAATGPVTTQLAKSTAAPTSSSEASAVRAFAAAAQSSTRVEIPAQFASESQVGAPVGAKAIASVVSVDINDSKRVATKAQLASPALESPPPSSLSTPKPDSAGATSTFVLSAGLAPSQSWFSANKYILGVLLLIATIVGAFLFFR